MTDYANLSNTPEGDVSTEIDGVTSIVPSDENNRHFRDLVAAGFTTAGGTVLDADGGEYPT